MNTITLKKLKALEKLSFEKLSVEKLCILENELSAFNHSTDQLIRLRSLFYKVNFALFTKNNEKAKSVSVKYLVLPPVIKSA